MSQWRRVALEAVPTCKRVIEESRDPAFMWLALWDETSESKVSGETIRRQIYDFALRCFRAHEPEILSSAVWMFFHAAIGAYIVGSHQVREDLPKHLSTNDFRYWAEVFTDQFPSAQLLEATKHFTSAKHGNG